MNNEEKKFITLTPFKLQVIQSFPYIDADFDALTNYQLFQKIVEYLNITVDNVNLLSNDFKTLYNYVHDYFDNLDVQEEINNKLDEMAESGELQEIIADYLNTKAIFCYDNVEDLKGATNLINGSYVKTLGYYTKNDGGSALYKIEEIQNNLIHQELLNNGLYASLIAYKVNIKQLGAYGDSTHNDTTIIQKAIDLYNDITIDNGTYLMSEIDIKANKYVHGNGTLKIIDNLCDDISKNYYPIIIRDNSTIENLTIDGNKDNNQSFRVADLITTMGDNIKILNNTLINVIDSGIMFSETINSVCKGNKIFDSRDCGIYCNNNNTNKIMNSIVENNYIENSETSGISLKRGCRFIKIINNYLLNCEFGITNENASSDTDFSTEFDIIDNVLRCETPKNIGIDTRGGYNCNVSGNRLYNYINAIVIQGSHDINVINNIIELNLTEAITYGSCGIQIVGRNVEGYNIAYNINIENNIIDCNYFNLSSFLQRCIHVVSSTNTSNINILNNLIKGNTYTSGITTSSNVKDLIIKNNTINVGDKSIITTNRNLITDNNIVSGALLLNGPSYFAKDSYKKYFSNYTASAPAQSNDYYTNGDVIFAKFGNSTIFAWMFDGTNFKPINFD